jgi:hypothetical protein
MTRTPPEGSDPVTPQEARGAVTERPEPALEGLGDWRRTRTCGELTRRHASQQATLMGWVHRMRDQAACCCGPARPLRHHADRVPARGEGGALLERAAGSGTM